MDTIKTNAKGYTPKEYDDLLRSFFAVAPKDVDGLSNLSAHYWQRKLFRWCMKILVLDNAPDEWDLDYFWTHVFTDGAIGITDTPLGVLPLKCGWTGINVFERPTNLIFAVPVLGSFERTIGVDGALVRLQYDFGNALEFIERYAYFFAANDSALAVNLLNTKTAWIAEADSKAQAETLKKLYDDIAMGKPCVVWKNTNKNVPSNGMQFHITNVKNIFIAPELMELQRTFLNMFLTDIGIPNFNMQKSSRMNTEEVHGNDVEVLFSIQDWINSIQSGLDVANELFGLQLKVRARAREEIIEMITHSGKIGAGTTATDNTGGEGIE